MIKWLGSLRKHYEGGEVRPLKFGVDYHLGDKIPGWFHEGRVITDPDEAEALGLTVDAHRLRCATCRQVDGKDALSPWAVEMLAAINESTEALELGDCE